LHDTADRCYKVNVLLFVRDPAAFQPSASRPGNRDKIECRPKQGEE